ncbi:hypothetical protein LEP1GSC041_0372 [Leptospira noguchii str. 2006001870]|nr:hypothetical protein LEP1GSC041_0372 [Leptospira noguchii str. 2006001870]EMS89521.1 hypothetical protein LEP1GSC073_4392 [Leptospira noguchii str. Cascata]
MIFVKKEIDSVFPLIYLNMSNRNHEIRSIIQKVCYYNLEWKNKFFYKLFGSKIISVFY